MSRLRWSKAAIPTPPSQPKLSKAPREKRTTHQQHHEQLLEERRLLIFQLTWQAEQKTAAQKRALSVLALVDSLMIIGLGLLVTISKVLLGAAGADWRFLFSAAAILSALLLILSLYLSLASQLTWRAGSFTGNLTSEKLLTVPREMLVKNALVKLEAQEQTMLGLRKSFRQALFLLSFALGLFLLLIILLAA